MLVLVLTLLPVAFAQAACLEANPVQVSKALTPSTLTYSASYNGMPVRLVRELQFNAETGVYSLTSLANSFFGKIEEKGLFLFEADNQTPLKNMSYQYSRSIFGKKKKERLQFDYEAGVAKFSRKDKQRQVELNQPYETRLSYQLRLQMSLLNQCDEFVYPVIARGKPKNYRFEQVGEEVISTPMGELRTVKIERIRDDQKRQTTLWFAPALDFLLVKLVQVETDGQDYQIGLSSGDIGGIPLSQVLSRKVGHE